MEKASGILSGMLIHFPDELCHRWSLACFLPAEHRIWKNHNRDVGSTSVADSHTGLVQFLLGACGQLLWQKAGVCCRQFDSLRLLYLGRQCAVLQELVVEQLHCRVCGV